jgi:predicted transcriptional regulator
MALKGNKEMMTISLSPDTKERLKKYALQNRKSVSQAITDWIWNLPITDDGLETGIKENTGVEEK